MHTELWAARIERELTPEEEQAMMEPLPPERRERLARTRSATVRREALSAWTLLRLALWERFGLRELPDVRWAERGKPDFPEFAGRLHFNLSHTAGAVLVGLSDEPIGVDIERVRPVHPRILKRLEGIETAEDFFREWVALEAKGKRSGRGILAMLEEGFLPWERTLYYPVRIFDGYEAGVAVSPGFPPPRVKMYTL